MLFLSSQRFEMRQVRTDFRADKKRCTIARLVCFSCTTRQHKIWIQSRKSNKRLSMNWKRLMDRYYDRKLYLRKMAVAALISFQKLLLAISWIIYILMHQIFSLTTYTKIQLKFALRMLSATSYKRTTIITTAAELTLALNMAHSTALFATVLSSKKLTALL